MRHTFAGLMGPEITTDLTTFDVKGGGVQFRNDVANSYYEAERVWLQDHDEGSLPAFRHEEQAWQTALEFGITHVAAQRHTSAPEHFRLTILSARPKTLRDPVTRSVMFFSAAGRIHGGVGNKLPHHLASWQRPVIWFNRILYLNGGSEESLEGLRLRFSKKVQDAYAVWLDQRKEAGL